MRSGTKKLVQVISLITISLLFLVFSALPALADDTAGSVVGFNYKVEYPENQIDKEKGYFDLVMNPGEKQDVKIILSNPGKEKVTIDVSLNGTKTNPNGVIEYGTTEIKNDKSLKFPFEKVVSAPKSVTLAGGEVKELVLKINMPETSFDGIILGGIQLKKANQNSQQKSQGATVRNEYTYIVAMSLRNSEKSVMPNIQIKKAEAAQRNYRNSILINLSNTEAALVTGNLSVESQIMKKGSKEVLFERKQSGMSIAPNSYLDFYISMNGDQMVPGDYTADILVTIDDKKWKKSLDFTITKEEADQYNKRDVGLVQSRGLDWKLVGFIVGGVLVFAIVVFIIIRVIQKNKKKEKTSSKQTKTKKKR